MDLTERKEIKYFKHGGCKNNWAHVRVYDDATLTVEYMGKVRVTELQLVKGYSAKDLTWGQHLVSPVNELMRQCREAAEKEEQ